ncbi:CoA ester lyase [Sphingosinicella sp. YJ22]|uniref:HpcH/HpaI aldolase/citrate lyase family protein n=1 Tax=Sphingosinicella sp. YJ22 TaxID=1104780 RepID=UPI00140BFA28|nr:CoA ester lyase [Sphingosinicella sp. YJ22]
MAIHDLTLCRSLLFLPASNPRAIEKARQLEADMIVLDLEDAVPEDQKDSARVAAVAAAAEGFGGRPVAIRINGVGHRCHGDDMIATRYSKAPYVILPKAEKERQIVGTHQVSEKPVLAMIETPAGVLWAGALAPHTAGLIAGTNDLSAALRIPPGSGRAGLVMGLQQVVAAARAAGVAAFDGVYNRLDDFDGLAAEAREGRSFGFDGKSVIHPAQIDTVNQLFSPSEQELEAAAALVAAATDGAERYDGRMIEALHVAEARALIAKARR